jgi:hypothetical protein
MITPSLRLLAGAAALALASVPAAAQMVPVNPFSFGVSGGAAIPTGGLGDRYNTGYSVDGIINVRVPTLPVSFRGEVGLTQFGAKASDNVALRSISGVANLVLPFAPGPTAVVRPYLIGGVGAYGLRQRTTGSGATFETRTDTRLGLNGGVGLEIPLTGISVFGEARYTSVFADGENTSWVPVRVGIRF